MSHPIPLIYRIVFTYIDPFFCTMGAYMHLADQTTALVGYSPLAKSVPSHTDKLLLENMAGFFITLGVLEALLLRVRGRDVAVWRCVQAAVTLLDVAMVVAHARALSVEGRWDVGSWRGDDYRNIVGNAVFGVIRLACALGVGMGSSEDAAGGEGKKRV